jgi:hypothetical protein
MKLPARFSLLFFIGVLVAGSTALGYYYYYVYAPPLKAAEQFMRAMESGDVQALQHAIIMTANVEDGELHEASEEEANELLMSPFERGRILDQHKREGKERDYYYLVYREPDAQVYALLATRVGDGFRIVISEKNMGTPQRYAWKYDWTN